MAVDQSPLTVIKYLEPHLEVMENFSVILNDPVHGHIELDPLYVNIIDTPQFQRLRFLSQCGAAQFVYPGANHTRFEHCIGVCHLAGSFCKSLQEKQPELQITDADVKCVAIAGLCHDLGHGPFSHVFDGFMSNFHKQWKHEYASIAMFDYLIKENCLEMHFSSQDLIFIKELIHPQSHEGDAWPYKGRGPEKSFLYDIVSNKKNGIDVDKWDYIVRDCYFMGIKTAFDYGRLMKFISVLEVNNEKQICARDKEVDNVYQLFHSRTRLYRQAYLHKTNLIIGYMICQALTLANNFIFIEGEKGKKYKVSDTINDMVAYSRLNDGIFHTILNSSDENLKPAKKWLERIITRQLPIFVGSLKCNEKSISEEVLRKELVECSKCSSINVDPCDVIILKAKWDCGMNHDDPINYMWFFSKDSPNIPYKLQQESKAAFMPKEFKEVQYIVYYEGSNSSKFDFLSRMLQSLSSQRANGTSGPA